MSLPESPVYVDIDWAAELHAVCVPDAAGEVTVQFTVAHTADGFTDLLRRLGRLTEERCDVAVAIERPDGRLVDALQEAGHPVVPVSPNAIATWREGDGLAIAAGRLLRTPGASGEHEASSAAAVADVIL